MFFGVFVNILNFVQIKSVIVVVVENVVKGDFSESIVASFFVGNLSIDFFKTMAW